MTVRKTLGIFSLIATQVLLSFFTWSYLFEKIAARKFVCHANISGVSVKGLSFNQAVRELKKNYAPPPTPTIIITAGEKELPLNLYELGAEFLYTKAVNDALQRQRAGPGLEGLNRTLKQLVQGPACGLPVGLNETLLAEKLSELNRIYAKQAVNATLQFENGRALIVPEENGRAVDIEATIKKFQELKAPLPDRVEAVTFVVRPEIRVKDLADFTHVLGEFKTSFNTTQENRVHNIKIACAAVNNTIIQPGQILSFNEKVGQVTRENGYRLAPVIKSSRLEADYGGGICQVSTTLYNAAREAELEITERHPHTIPVPYVKEGMDATVVNGKLDLKIKNNYSTPVYISCYMEKGAVMVKILGKRNPLPYLHRAGSDP